MSKDRIRKVEYLRLLEKAGIRIISSTALMISLICGQSLNLPALADTPKQPLKVGFILVGPVADYGWDYQHDQGRKYLEDHLKGKVQTTVAENIHEGAELERVMEKMVAQGNKLIFSTSYGYLDPALRVAARHPDIIVMQCQRAAPPSAKNLGSYFANQYEPMYVAGFVAGRLSKTGKLGYVGGHPVPVVLCCLNSFTLGAKMANPKVKVNAVWTNSWFDATSEAEATRGLIDSGVDVVASQLCSGMTVAKTAEKNGVCSVDTNADLNSFAPKGWLTGNCWNWGPLYVKVAQEVIDHKWKAGDRLSSLKDGYIQLSPFGKVVPEKARKEALTLKHQIEIGQLVIFKGPLKDRDGKEQVKSGNVPDAKALREMNWVVDGVEGSLPKK